MRIKFDVDCNPEVARAFLGLPDAAPIQQALMEEMGMRMSSGLETMDPEMLMKIWLPLGARGLEQAQNMGSSQLRIAAGDAEGEVER